MTPLHKTTAIAISALALAALPTVAIADQPFKNCTEAYSQGYANIPKSDPRYGEHLDRDKDGIGCDKPPADFTPATKTDSGQTEAENTENTENTETTTSDTDKTALAETGGNNTTPWIAAGGAAVVLAGGGLVALNRKRRALT
ncbi:excalibur calcium-binding domain-containing protein [Streptomyces pacificus]|uniref:LPXTG cell wall anchor domain-containing protein n=1 Tax=Streptomyces pacificus TaxID=2705029 RepID=A0A6A0AV93_9ACTN|nr:excalibur calcium-binding domain-containing protein [Streptomyces pacificus]GFH36608.1 LPXTG cell wall anchor domain-containing protein [Streptomyces pacificus]